MIIDNVFVTDVSDTMQTIGVFLKETAESAVVYVIEHQYEKGASDAEVKSAIQTKIDAFVPMPQENKRESLAQDLLKSY